MNDNKFDAEFSVDNLTRLEKHLRKQLKNPRELLKLEHIPTPEEVLEQITETPSYCDIFGEVQPKEIRYMDKEFKSIQNKIKQYLEEGKNE